MIDFLERQLIANARAQIQDLVFARLIDPVVALVNNEMLHFKATYHEQGLKIKVKSYFSSFFKKSNIS